MYSMAPTGVSLIVYGVASVLAVGAGMWTKLRARKSGQPQEQQNPGEEQ